MSTYVDLKIRKLSLFTWRSFFDKKTLALFFTNGDLVINHNAKYDDTDDETYTQYKYSTTIEKAKKRLNACGYTLKKIKNDFIYKKSNCLDYNDLRMKLNLDENKLDELIERKISQITFKKWSNSVKKYSHYLLDNKLEYTDKFYKTISLDLAPKTECDKLVFKSILNSESDSFFGCLYDEFDPLNTVRLILENCAQTDTIEIDISEMVGYTYESIEDMQLDNSLEKTIVLVEGVNDKNILEFSFKHIYPHLADLYYFMDFGYAQNKKREGGVGALSNSIKTFIAAKLKGRFIALYDNDTIGVQAKKKLLKQLIRLPDNYRILNYPNIKLAKRYPTIGTNGKTIFDNINGRACSIELYLPTELLKQETDTLSPIRWESYIEDKEDSDYQGVITNKKKINESFDEYKNDIERGIKQFNLNDWTNMKILLDELIDSFN